MQALETASLVAVAMTAAVALFSAAILIGRPAERRDQAAFLAAFLILYGIFKANDLLTTTGGYAAAPMLAVVTTPVRFLFGATLYFYARAMTSPSEQWLRPRDATALLWPIAGMIVVIPFILMSPEDKNSLMAGEFRTEEIREWFLRACVTIFVLFLASTLLYLAGAFRLLLRHTRTVRQLFSNIEDKSLSWLRLVLLAIAAGWAWNIVAGLWALQGGKPLWVDVAATWFELGWISATAACGLLQRPVFSRGKTAGAPHHGDGDGEKYARSALTDERMARIAASLERAMRIQQLYRDPDLSLRVLSDHLGISGHYVTQTLNEKLGESFFDFVNRHRIAEALVRLESTDEPILTIAHDLGYNSRSTFNAAFKRRVGMTPSAFRQSVNATVQTSSAPSFG